MKLQPLDVLGFFRITCIGRFKGESSFHLNANLLVYSLKYVLTSSNFLIVFSSTPIWSDIDTSKEILSVDIKGQLHMQHPSKSWLLGLKILQAWTTLRARETVALGRELMGANGILLDFHVAKVSHHPSCFDSTPFFILLHVVLDIWQSDLPGPPGMVSMFWAHLFKVQPQLNTCFFASIINLVNCWQTQFRSKWSHHHYKSNAIKFLTLNISFHLTHTCMNKWRCPRWTNFHWEK